VRLLLLCLPWASLFGQTCVQTLSPNSRTVPAATNPLFQGTFNVTSNLGTCNWTSSSTVPWMAVQLGQSGRGNGIVGYSVDNNVTPVERTGTIQVGTAVFTVTQAGSPCNVTLTLQGGADVGAEGGTRQLQIATTCEWTAVGPSWISLTPASGRGNATIALAIARNDTTTARSGVITVLGQSVTITQAAGGCTFTVSPEFVDVPSGAGFGPIEVVTTSGCEWTATSNVPWIHIGSLLASPLLYVVDENTTGVARTGTLTVAGRTVTIRQGAAVGPRFTSAGIVHSASYQPGGVAPGEIVTIYGEELGPATLTTAELEAGAVTKSLAGTRMLFDGVAAPLLYTSRTQVSAIVPYAVAGKTNVPVVAEYQGARSAPVTVRILPAAPGIYSLDSSGSGPGAILNQDGTVNSIARPAAAGEVVILFATGEGLTTPLPEDGHLTPSVEPLPRPRLKVTVTMGGVECPVLYAGAPPGLVAGAMQVNVQLPDGVPRGETVPVVLGVGESMSLETVTIAIKR
jgi:uncharacterized protein (TIGR03437 family)